MKPVGVLALALMAAARPDKEAKILSQVYNLREDQSFDHSFETSNNIFVEESGISYPGFEPETGNYVVSGSYEFEHPDGTVTYIQYIADENGYRALGDAIPVFDGRVNIQDT